jgi:hypothetical protein
VDGHLERVVENDVHPCAAVTIRPRAPSSPTGHAQTTAAVLRPGPAAHGGRRLTELPQRACGQAGPHTRRAMRPGASTRRSGAGLGAPGTPLWPARVVVSAVRRSSSAQVDAALGGQGQHGGDRVPSRSRRRTCRPSRMTSRAAGPMPKARHARAAAAPFHGAGGVRASLLRGAGGCPLPRRGRSRLRLRRLGASAKDAPQFRSEVEAFAGGDGLGVGRASVRGSGEVRGRGDGGRAGAQEVPDRGQFGIGETRLGHGVASGSAVFGHAKGPRADGNGVLCKGPW